MISGYFCRLNNEFGKSSSEEKAARLMIGRVENNFIK